MKIPVHNNTSMPIYVGADMVPPGEIRHFEEQNVPHHLRPVAAEEAAEVENNEPLAELLAGNVATIVEALKGMPLDDVERLGELEQKGQARKRVLSAISEIQLKAAEKSELLAKVSALSDADLADQIASLGTGVDPELVAALEAESSKRNLKTAE